MGLFKDCGCGCGGRKAKIKFQTSVIAALIFFIVANPQTYMLTRRLFSSRLSSVNGNPTLSGLLLHTVVYGLIVWGTMQIKPKREQYEAMVGAAPAPAPAPSPAASEKAPEQPDIIDRSVKAEAAPAPAPSVSAKEDTHKAMMVEDEGISFAPIDTDLQMGEFDAMVGPAPTRKEMTCGCPDGSSVRVTK